MNTSTVHGSGAAFFRSAANWQFIFLLIMLTSGYLSIAVSQIALGLALMTMLYRWVFLKEAPPVTGLEKTAALLALWALLMIPFSTYVSQSVIFYRRFYLFSVIWVAAAAATTQRRRLLMMLFLLAGALAISIWAQINHYQLTGGILSQRMIVAFNAMTSGALFMMAILIAVSFLMVPGLGRWMKLGIGIAILPVVLALVMTMTRSAQLGLIAGLGIMLLLAKPRVIGIYLGLILAATLVLGIFGEHLMSARMWSRVNPQYLVAGENTTLRLDMWRGGWEMVKAHPVTGVGDRGLKEISPEYYTSAYDDYFGHLHSNIVHMAVIWGSPGLILGQAFIWAGLWYLIKRWRKLRRTGGLIHAPVQFAWVLAAIGVWVSFYIAGLTEWYFGDAESMLIYLAILGCALGPGNSRDREPA